MSSEERLASAILESLTEGVLAVDAHGVIVSGNPAASALLGLGDAYLVGASIFETVRQVELHALTRAVIRTDTRGERELTLFGPRQRILRAQGVPCAAGDARAVLVLQDVTEHHRYDQLRKELVANVSHELKSPLTSIKSLTETLLDGALDDPGNNRRFVSLIEEDASRLARLIDDLLTLSQIESRAVPLRISSFLLRPEIEAVLAPLEVLIEQKETVVSVEVASDLCVTADPDRLRQVLANLVDNAIKYNRDGGKLAIAARHLETPRPHVRISVEDEGAGISESDCERIFERFYRVDRARSRELGGTGLGLSIVKHIVEGHGGEVWVESAPPRPGSRFVLTLPIAGPETPRPGRPSFEGDTEPGEPGLEAGIRALQERLVVMAGLAEEAVGRAVQALVLRDALLARHVLERDDAIDEAEVAIDRLCLRLLTDHALDAAQLRLVTTAFKLNSDLERMGDLAVSISHRTLEVLQMPLLSPLVDIPVMAERVQAMVKDSLDSLVRRDLRLAREVCARDVEVDRLNDRVYRTMLSWMVGNPSSVERAVGLMLIARSLERIADHATNVAEGVYYIASGRSIKHRTEDD